MRKVNTAALDEFTWSSPKGTFAGAGKQVSQALGRDATSTDMLTRHPFDVEILRVPPGKAPYPYHAHGAQWEFYHVIAGSGRVRHAGGEDRIVQDDAFVFKPGEPHQLINDGKVDLVVYVVADNPIGEWTYFPDSGKLRGAGRTMRSDDLPYFDGEE